MQNNSLAIKPKTYRKKIFRQFGKPQVFEWTEEKMPENLDDYQILVKVHYIGVNFADIIARKGHYKWAGKLPICPGFEASGIVIERGIKATDFSIGEKIMCITRFGAYSEYLILDCRRAIKIPAEMDLKEAAAFPAVYLTAYHCINEILRARTGESILITAVAGGVGTAALQVAKAKGLITYGLSSSKEKLDFARKQGLDYAINYKTEHFQEKIMELTQNKGVRFLLDSLGGVDLKKGLQCLSRGGHAVTIGAASVLPEKGFNLSLIRAGIELFKAGFIHPFNLIEKNQGLSGTQILLWWDDLDHMNRLIEELLELYKNKKIMPLVSQVIPLAEVDKAHALIESRQTTGKILLTCL